MARCIVAPVDGSGFGEHALPLAAVLARRAGALLRIVHVHVPLIVPSGAEVIAFSGSWNEAAREQEREYLHGLAARVSARYGVRVDTALMEGPVAPALERFIRDCGAELVVMSTHAHVRLHRLLHHGVAEHVSRSLPIPTVLVRPPAEDAAPDLDREPRIRHILVPLDGSRYAEAIVDPALRVGRAAGARLTLLRVVRPETTIGYTLLAQDGHINHHRLSSERTAAMQYLGSVAERMRAAGARVDTRVEVAEDPASAIVRFASTGDAAGPVDLVAMEAHPHGAVARILGAHTADRVLRDSPVPVLLVEPPLAPSAARRAGSATLPLPDA